MKLQLFLIVAGLIASFAAFNAYAFERQGNWQETGYGQAEFQVAVYNESSGKQILPAQKGILRHTFLQAPSDRQNEFFLELCAYIVIIMIYSLYGLKQS